MTLHLFSSLTEDSMLCMAVELTVDEIKQASFEMAPWKSPGRDGSPSVTIKLIGKLLAVMCASIFCSYGGIPFKFLNQFYEYLPHP